MNKTSNFIDKKPKIKFTEGIKTTIPQIPESEFEHLRKIVSKKTDQRTTVEKNKLKKNLIELSVALAFLGYI